MQLVRLVRVHYSVPQLARQDLLKCLRLMLLVHGLLKEIWTDLANQVNKIGHQLEALKIMPLVHRQQVLVVHRPHRHSIHSSDSHLQLLQVTDQQVDRQAPDQIMDPMLQQALDQIMGPLPQQAPDQIMDPDPQLVTQVHSDEASLTSQQPMAI